VALVGLAQAEGSLPVAELVRRGITLRGEYAYLREDFASAIAMLAEHPLPLDWLTIVPLSEGPEAFRRLVTAPGGTIKVLFEMGG
jgi:threonine dehydrogenase-like Zn-dependent dehydrogenase